MPCICLNMSHKIVSLTIHKSTKLELTLYLEKKKYRQLSANQPLFSGGKLPSFFVNSIYNSVL